MLELRRSEKMITVVEISSGTEKEISIIEKEGTYSTGIVIVDSNRIQNGDSSLELTVKKPIVAEKKHHFSKMKAEQVYLIFVTQSRRKRKHVLFHCQREESLRVQINT